jgi:hypothetical protein
LGGPHALHGHTGVVSKAPRFYELYTGPHSPEFNAVKASGKFSPRNDTFTFTGTNQGRINSGPAVYVWGIDRNGNLSSGPFTGRPGVTFDAVVVVKFDSSLTPTATVFAGSAMTPLSSSSVHVHGRTVSVTVPGSLLPSTGLPPSQFRFNYWPEDGQGQSSSDVGSFLPEFNTAQVGTGK